MAAEHQPEEETTVRRLSKDCLEKMKNFDVVGNGASGKVYVCTAIEFNDIIENSNCLESPKPLDTTI